MNFVNGFFGAVFVWLISGICAIVLERLSKNLFHKTKLERSKGSLLLSFITNILVWIPIIVAVKIEWSDQYAIIAGFTVLLGFILGIFSHDLKVRSGVFIIIVLLGGAILDASGLESDLEGKTEFIIIASAVALGYVVGDFTKKSRSIKE